MRFLILWLIFSSFANAAIFYSVDRPAAVARPTKDAQFIGCSPGLIFPRGEEPTGFYPTARSANEMILPLAEDVKSSLEPGDLIVFGNDEKAREESKKVLSIDFYRLATQDYPHVGMVYRTKENKLAFLQSPGSPPKDNLIPDSYKDYPFHIFRLRRDIEPAKRNKFLADINAWAQFFGEPILEKRGGEWRPEPIFSYDQSFLPLPTLDKRKRELLEKSFSAFGKADKDYYKPLFVQQEGENLPRFKFYCSSLPPSVYHLSGLPLPDMKAFGRELENLEKTVEKILGRAPAKGEMNFLFEQYFDHFFQSSNRWPAGLASEKELQEFVRSEDRALPPSVEKYKRYLLQTFQQLVLLPPTTRAQTFDVVHGPIISPMDIVNNVFQPDRFLTYAGTYVGKNCLSQFE